MISTNQSDPTKCKSDIAKIRKKSQRSDQTLIDNYFKKLSDHTLVETETKHFKRIETFTQPRDYLDEWYTQTKHGNEAQISVVLEVFKHMLVMLGEYYPYDDCVSCNTKQANEKSKYFGCDLNLLIENVVILRAPNVFYMIVWSIAES